VYEESRSLLKANGGTVISFSNYNSAAGNISIEVATATGDPPRVNGTGSIAKLTTTTIQTGYAEIIVDTASEISAPENRNISLIDRVHTSIVVR